MDLNKTMLAPIFSRFFDGFFDDDKVFPKLKVFDDGFDQIYFQIISVRLYMRDFIRGEKA